MRSFERNLRVAGSVAAASIGSLACGSDHDYTRASISEVTSIEQFLLITKDVNDTVYSMESHIDQTITLKIDDNLVATIDCADGESIVTEPEGRILANTLGSDICDSDGDGLSKEAVNGILNSFASGNINLFTM